MGHVVFDFGFGSVAVEKKKVEPEKMVGGLTEPGKPAFRF